MVGVTNHLINVRRWACNVIWLGWLRLRRLRLWPWFCAYRCFVHLTHYCWRNMVLTVQSITNDHREEASQPLLPISSFFRKRGVRITYWLKRIAKRRWRKYFNEKINIAICALFPLARSSRWHAKREEMWVRKSGNRLRAWNNNEKEASYSLFFVSMNPPCSRIAFRHVMKATGGECRFSLDGNLPVAALDIKETEKEEYCPGS